MIRTITEVETLELFKQLAPKDSCILKVDDKFFGYDNHPEYPESRFESIKKAYIFKNKDSVFNLLKWFPHKTYEIIELNP